MENLITINNQSVLVKQYNGKRVLTFKDIDVTHGRPDGTARRNFNANKVHFVEGEDYYKIQPNEIRTVGIKSPNGGIVVTESGYLMLAKSFTDDLSWAVQRELVNSYFKYTPEKCKQCTVDDYEYFDKKYNGEYILTSVDINYLTGMEICKINAFAKKYLRYGAEVFHLIGNTLIDFKNENPKVSNRIPHLLVFTKTGFEKICKAFNVKVETPTVFIETRAEQVEKPKTEYAVVIGNPRIKDKIDAVRKQMTAVDVLLSKYYRHNITMTDMAALQTTLQKLGVELGVDIESIARERVGVTTTYKY